ncbi:MAG: hypothetical protein ACFE8B_15765 [Candidatus Hermodarchaeota archaeon]
MVNVGLFGGISVGKKSILRIFADYLNNGKIDKLLENLKPRIIKSDFSGELNARTKNLTDTLDKSKTETLHPARVIFQEDRLGTAYSIFAVGGDKQQPIVRSSIKTFSSYVTEVIAIFSVDRDLESQFEFFNDVRFFPTKIHVCINKIDLLTDDRYKKVRELRKEITNYFNERKITVEKFHITCSESIEGFEKYNENAVIMILLALKFNSNLETRYAINQVNLNYFKPIKLKNFDLMFKTISERLEQITILNQETVKNSKVSDFIEGLSSKLFYKKENIPLFIEQIEIKVNEFIGKNSNEFFARISNFNDFFQDLNEVLENVYFSLNVILKFKSEEKFRKDLNLEKFRKDLSGILQILDMLTQSINYSIDAVKTDILKSIEEMREWITNEIGHEISSINIVATEYQRISLTVKENQEIFNLISSIFHNITYFCEEMDQDIAKLLIELFKPTNEEIFESFRFLDEFIQDVKEILEIVYMTIKKLSILEYLKIDVEDVKIISNTIAASPQNLEASLDTIQSSIYQSIRTYIESVLFNIKKLFLPQRKGEAPELETKKKEKEPGIISSQTLKEIVKPIPEDITITPRKKQEIKDDEPQPSQMLKNIKITRGGDWKVENNKSIFNFKVKVLNASDYVITNVQIFLTSIPSGLITQNDRYKIDILNPNAYESPSFKFIAKDSCVGDFIKGFVIFNDHLGKQQTTPIIPFEIEYVCNLLVPKSINEEAFRKNTAVMKENKLTFECILPPEELKPEVLEILEQNNFFILKSAPESETPDVKKINAYAEGKYDKQDVALSIIMKKIEEKTNQLIIKAMSTREEKIIDLLKDISIKCDSLKISSDNLSVIEITCENCENVIILTDYMKLKEFIICEACGEEIKIK